MSFPQGELWARIAAFELDRPGDALGFSGRLARDNAWTRDYARRAIEEYKRFVFLAVTCDHPVTPSDAVDQVWHEHLTYTRSYWDEFCGEVLGRKLHHDPTRGGTTERAKFREWYARTLRVYAEVFGAPPPADIWPGVEERFRDAPHFARINTASNWIVPKPRLQRLRWVAAGAGVLALAGCTPVVFGGLWPFTLNGAEFLKVFPVLWLGALVVAWAWRSNARRPHADQRSGAAGPTDPYLAAFVAGGVERVASAAAAALAACGAVKVTSGGAGLSAQGATDSEWHPVERLLHARLALQGSTGSDFGSLVRALEAAVAPLREEAVANGWMVAGDVARRVRLNSWLIAMSPAVLGLARIVQGVSNNRPVGFLVGMLVFGVIIGSLIFWRLPLRSRSGERWLEFERDKSRRLEKLKQCSDLPAGTLPLAVALFGTSALAATELSDMRRVLTPPASSSGGDSGSSDSGGGGDSGCGSGCGGCGGGD